MKMSEAISDELWETAWDVARRYKAFNSYGTKAKAVKALQRRCPYNGIAQCEDFFSSALNVYEAAFDVLSRDEVRVREETGNSLKLNFQSYDEEFGRICPKAPKIIVHSALQWVWYWNHLR
jgi:hypothetical protein